MFKKENMLKTICSCVCILMIVVVMVLQFTPYWTFTREDGSEATISIGDYVWFPNEDASNEFEEVVKDEVFPGERMSDNDVVNEIVMFPAITFGLAVFAFIACLLGRKNLVVVGAATVISGIAGVIGYVSSPALALSSAWTIHLIVIIVVALVGAATLALGIKELVKKIKTDKVLYSYH